MSLHSHNKPPRYNKIYRDKQNAKICGVFAGLGDYFGVDPTILRVLGIIGLFFSGPVMLVGYFLMCFLMEAKPADLFESKEEDEFWKGVRTQPKNTIRDVRHKFREIERRLRAAEAHVTSREYKLNKEFEDLEKK